MLFRVALLRPHRLPETIGRVFNEWFHSRVNREIQAELARRRESQEEAIRAYHEATMAAEHVVLRVDDDGSMLVRNKGVESTVHLMNMLHWKDIVLRREDVDAETI